MVLSKIITKFSRNANNKSNILFIHLFETPVGKIIGAADDNFIFIVMFEDSKNFDKTFQTVCDKISCRLVDNKNKILTQLEVELREYFDGYLKKFTVPIQTFGSDFQQSVWAKLRELPYASTQTYGGIAKALGKNASHARAIGAACGANSHVIVVPCHRVVAAGTKGGFSCGVDRKEWLLGHEAKHAK